MRILVVHTHYRQAGGEDVVFTSEVALLRSYGEEVLTAEFRNDELESMPDLRRAIVTIWNAEAYRRIRRLIREFRPQVMHVHNTFPLASPSIFHAARHENVPVVMTLHNYRLLCPGALLLRQGCICELCVRKRIPFPAALYGCWRGSRTASLLVALMLCVHNWLGTWHRCVDRYIAVTNFVRDKFIQAGWPPHSFVVKPNFVWPDPLKPSERSSLTASSLSLRSRRGYALFVGRLVSEKGVLTLIEAWKRIQGVDLKIVGDGPLLSTLKEMIRQMQTRSIELLGTQPFERVIELMKGARFLVFPSVWYETFGRVAVEAFACAVPVIASRLGAVAEVVEDGKTGLYFEPGDAADLAKKVCWAVEHPEEIARMGMNARLEYETKYSAGQNYLILKEIYDSVVRSSQKVSMLK